MYMGRISGRAITHSRCLWKADQIVSSIEVYARNGADEDIRRRDYSKILDAVRELAKLRYTTLSRVEYEKFQRRFWDALKTGAAINRADTEAINLVSTMEADRYKRLLKAGKRGTGWQPPRQEPKQETLSVEQIMRSMHRITGRKTQS
jgi:hypothetical protein